MGLFGIGGDSQSTQTSEQVTQSQGLNGRAINGRKNAVAQDGSFVLGNKASLTINNPIDNAATFKLVSDTTKAAIDAVTAAGAAATVPLASALETASTAKANVVDGGAAQASKTVIWVVGLLALGVAAFFYFRKS